MDENLLRVRMLGEFSISYGDTVISGMHGRSYRAWHLLAYLIYCRDRQIPAGELIRLLVDGESSANPGGALRYAIWRARRITDSISAAGTEFIVNKDGFYGCNPAFRFEVDAEAFEALCQTGTEAEDKHVKMDCLRKALEMYSGDFLSAFSGEEWVGALSAHYHNLYLNTVDELIPLLVENDGGHEAIRLCRNAIRLSPYHEPLYRQLMRCMIAAGRYGEAVEVYRGLSDMLHRELDVLPEEETQLLYRDALGSLESRGSRVLTPELIREQLQGAEARSGAMICNFADFRLYYQAEARSASRRGDAVHIGVLTVTGKDGCPLSGRSLTNAMAQVEEQIQECLRMGDVAASCSASQYILLLVQANLENSVRVCDRVAEAFSRAHPRSPARILNAVLPLEPLHEKDLAAGNWIK